MPRTPAMAPDDGLGYRSILDSLLELQQLRAEIDRMRPTWAPQLLKRKMDAFTTLRWDIADAMNGYGEGQQLHGRPRL